MPQETNLNTSPYFDDFDPGKGYYKTLFKPSYPIQARELNTLQSTLQNQVERFGSHIFKDGSSVIDGQLSLDNPFPAIQVESEFNGVPISLYFDQLVGKTIRGQSSNVVAEIREVLTANDSERDTYTLYLRYLQSGGSQFDVRAFSDGETLLLEEPVTYGNFTIQAGQGICNTISTNAATYGSSVAVAEGVYFVRGYFVSVTPQRIFLDQYSITPSYNVGFEVIENIVTADEDTTLYDNAQGFANFASPGADRFQIQLVLTKKELDDVDTNNFISILGVLNGTPQFFTQKTTYSLIRDELARRMADQSGNFYVQPFSLFVRDSLNDRVSAPTGVYYDDQTTVNGNEPKESSMVYEVGPGKAYVNGYDVETISPKLLDVDKTRTTKTDNDQVLQYNAGTLAIVNNCYGVAPLGIGTTTVVSLIDSRIGSDKFVAVGTTIGVARVYDFVPESNYEDDTSRFKLRLFDIQTFTQIGLSTAITLSVPTFIQGKRSNASGYLRTGITSSASLTLYQVSGTFLENEQIIINGIDDGRLIKTVRDYSISDVKSVYSQVGVSTFNADLVLNKTSPLSKAGSQFRITAAFAGISTVSSGLGINFTNKISSGDIISYANPNFGTDVIYNKVEAVSAGGTTFTVSALTSVSGINVGTLPTSTTTVNDVVKITPDLDSNDSSFITLLNKPNIASISLENNELTQRRTYTNQPYSGNSITISITESDVFFESFDEDRFVITYADGSKEPMSSDKYNLDATGKQLTFNGLSKSGSGVATVVATVKNLKPNSKTKRLNRANSLIVNLSNNTSSGIGTTTLNDGLTYSNVYGVRVQDDQICLRVPDAIRVLGVFESADANDPTLPRLQLTSIDGPTNSNLDFTIGEQIVGQSSGAVAVVIGRSGVDTLEYVLINASQFTPNEFIKGKDSNSIAFIASKLLGSNNIIKNFYFDNGQRDTYYDYSRITRKKGIQPPKGKLKIVFQNYTIDSSDTGEFISVNSYPESAYKLDVPYYNNIKLTDFIDIRPRVTPYTLSSKSPFEFDSRRFDGDGQYAKYILAPDENLVTSYSYYLPRVDRVFLNQDGTFEIIKGIPNENPVPPQLKANAIDIATIYVPAYVFDTADVIVSMSRHKRYRMSDISLLEDRIQRVEEFTVLSALENKTENFVIKDAETGLDRFKCGFFADNFSSHVYQDMENPEFRCAIDKFNGHLRPLHYTTNLELQLGSEVISGIGTTFDPTADQSFVTDLGSIGIKKTGDLITLNYNEVLYGEQQFATRTENVTAFLVAYWEGTLELQPPIDSWFDERAITTNTFNQITTRVTRPDLNNTVVVNNTTQVSQPIRFTQPPRQQGGATPMDYTPRLRIYQGFAPATGPTVTGATGTINQNRGGTQANAFANGQAAIGAAGVERALADGFKLTGPGSIQEWINRTGAVVGPEAAAKYGITGKTL